MRKAVKQTRDPSYRGSRRKLRKQKAKDHLRKKYGPTEKAAPVVFRSLATGEIIEKPKPVKRPLGEGSYSPVLDALADEAGFASYATYLQSPTWGKLRQRVLHRDQYKCVKCGSSVALTVHHDRYINLRAKEIKHLKTMCWPCHRKIHRRNKQE